MKSPRQNPDGPHFNDELWADFARDVAGETDRAAMQAHLDNGCEPCRGMLHPLRAVHQMAMSERTLVIPEELVIRAKSIAEVAPSASGWMDNLIAIAVQLIQSSDLDWQPAGVRSLGEAALPAAGRMLFKADDYAVCLNMETLLGGEVAEIVGEIVNERERAESLEGIPVQMVAGGQTLSETATNRFGEFLIECPIRKNTTLRFALKNRGQRIDLPLGSGPESDTR